MRIHTSATYLDVKRAAELAGVCFTADEHGSRRAQRAFEIHLEGNSNRRPNNHRGMSMYDKHGWGTGYAATWDQWGIFLAHLFSVDPELFSWADKHGAAGFHYRTDWRFTDGFTLADSHGDHRFQYDGTPGEQACTKCSAVLRWNVAPSTASAS